MVEKIVDALPKKVCPDIEQKDLIIIPVFNFRLNFSVMQKSNQNRDLMVVLKEAHMAPELLHTETEWLNTILNRVESTRNLATACEIINLNRYTIEKRFHKVIACLQEKNLRPFVFIFNKN